MQIFIEVSVAAAIRAGRTASGWLPIEVTDADVLALSVAQRGVLADALLEAGESRRVRLHIAYGPALVARPTPSEATIGALVALIDWRIAETAAKAAADAAARAVATAARERTIAEQLAQPAGAWCGQSHATSQWTASAQYRDDPRIAARLVLEQAIATQREQERQAHKAAQRGAETKAAAEKAAAEKALQEQQTLARAAWVAERGTDSQRARLAAGVLPIVEVMAAVRAETFAALDDGTPRYERLAREDMATPDEGDCEHGDPNYDADTATELTEAQFAALSAIKAAAPAGSIVQARIHTASCDDCKKTTSRYSALVTVDWHGTELSREYALPDA
jgi:hypothetical protein